jgi:hypothetical protein
VSLLLVWAGFAQGDAATEASTGVTARVRLLAPLTTKFSRKGDLVSARVLLPANYQGSILEGEVREVRAGGPGGKSSYVEFDFHALHVGDKVLPVSASIVESLNSRSQSELDEEGSALETTGRGVAGKLIAGVFTRNSAALLRLSAKAPDLSFLPGSEFVLQLQFRKGH